MKTIKKNTKDLTAFQTEGLLPYKIKGHTCEKAILKLESSSKGERSICYVEDDNSQMLGTIGYSWLECVI